MVQTMTAPSSPKPEDFDTTTPAPTSEPGASPAPQPTTGEPSDDDEESEEDEEPEAHRGSTISGTAESVAARNRAEIILSIAPPDTAEQAEKDGYVAGLIIGIKATLLASSLAEGLLAEMTEAVARGYEVPIDRIRAGVEADASNLLADYAYERSRGART